MYNHVQASYTPQAEEVGTGHMSSKNADVAPDLILLLFLRWLFLSSSGPTNRRAERSSE